MKSKSSSTCSQKHIDQPYTEHSEVIRNFYSPFKILINNVITYTPRSPKRYLPSRFSDLNFAYISDLPHACYMLLLCPLILINHSNMNTDDDNDNSNNKYVKNWGAGIAQSVERLAKGWTNEGSEFESR
jgi:hypothetical protein